MASVYARNGILQIKFKTKGNGYKQKSTGLKDTPENRKIVLNQLIPALEFKLKEKEKAKKIDFEPFEKFANLYLLGKEDLKTYFEIQSRVKKICTFFKNRDIRSIKVSELRAWIAQFNISSKTIKSYITDCRGVFDIAIQEEILDKNPFVHIKLKKNINEEKEDIQPFTAEEVERILKAAPMPLKNYLAIGFYTGMRSGEILGLQVSDIDFTSNIISVRRSISKGAISTPKTENSARDVPLFNVLKP